MKKVLSITTLLLTAILTSCSDEFLLKEPQALLYQDLLWQMRPGVEGKLISAYSALDGYGLSGAGTWHADIQGWDFWRNCFG